VPTSEIFGAALWAAPITRSPRRPFRAVGLALASVFFAVALQAGTVRAEPIGPERPATDPRPVEAALFVPAPPALFGPSQARPPAPTPPIPSSANAGVRGVPDQGVGSGRGEQAAALALQYVGAPYRWGGASPAGFDCSGFVWYVHKMAGLSDSRGLWGQMNAGQRVTRDNLQPGDTVFFANTYMPGLSHAGIYIGGGSFVHAIDESQGVGISSLNGGYWAGRYIGASRLR